MAKPYVKSAQKKTSSKYPSVYGSHESMIDKELTDKLFDHILGVVCRDDDGPYLTTEFDVKESNRTADMNRWCKHPIRLEKLKAALPEGSISED